MGSWQAYLESLVGNGHPFSKAAIIGYPEGGVWASSPEFSVIEREQTALIQAFSDPTLILANGVVLNGKWYSTRLAEDKKIIAKNGDAGALIVRTKRSIIIGVYERERFNMGVSMGKLEDMFLAYGY